MAERDYSEEQLRVIARLERLAYLLDARFRLPGTRVRVGLDALIGLVPMVGDGVALALSAYIIAEARKLSPSRAVMARMIGNVLIDAAVGTVPVAGDFFDVAFKANVRNLRLLGIRAGSVRNDLTCGLEGEG